LNFIENYARHTGTQENLLPQKKRRTKAIPAPTNTLNWEIQVNLPQKKRRTKAIPAPTNTLNWEIQVNLDKLL